MSSYANGAGLGAFGEQQAQMQQQGQVKQEPDLVGFASMGSSPGAGAGATIVAAPGQQMSGPLPSASPFGFSALQATTEAIILQQQQQKHQQQQQQQQQQQLQFQPQLQQSQQQAQVKTQPQPQQQHTPPPLPPQPDYKSFPAGSLAYLAARGAASAAQAQAQAAAAAAAAAQQQQQQQPGALPLVGLSPQQHGIAGSASPSSQGFASTPSVDMVAGSVQLSPGSAAASPGQQQQQQQQQALAAHLSGSAGAAMLRQAGSSNNTSSASNRQSPVSPEGISPSYHHPHQSMPPLSQSQQQQQLAASPYSAGANAGAGASAGPGPNTLFKRSSTSRPHASSNASSVATTETHASTSISGAAPGASGGAAGASSAPPPNGKHWWSADETQALVDGCNKYGVGSWKVMLKDPELAPRFDNRSAGDLKDRFRTYFADAYHELVS